MNVQNERLGTGMDFTLQTTLQTIFDSTGFTPMPPSPKLSQKKPALSQKNKTRSYQRPLERLTRLNWFVPEPWILSKKWNNLLDLAGRIEGRSNLEEFEKKKGEKQKRKQMAYLQATKDLVVTFKKLVQNQISQSDPNQRAFLLLGCSHLLPTDDWGHSAGTKKGKRLKSAEISPPVELIPVINEALQLRVPETDGSNELWLTQVLSIELPILLAIRFPELIVADDWIEPSVETMSATVDRLLDSDGWPSGECLPVFGALMASWHRTSELLDADRLPAETLRLIKAAAGQLLRIVGPDGRLMFTESKTTAMTAEPLEWLLHLIPDRMEQKMAQQSVHPLVEKQEGKYWRKKLKRHFDQPIKKKKPKMNHPKNKLTKLGNIRSACPPGNLSEYGESGIFRANWDCLSAKIGIRFDHGNLFTEISRFATLVKGNSFPQITIDQCRVSAIDQFDIMCEFHDQDVDYLELQVALENNVTLNRQFLLSHQDDFIMIADSVTLPRLAKIEYACDWSLAEGVAAMSETETREHYLTVEQEIHALVLPISLPEWQQGPTTGRFKASPSSLTVTEWQTGSGLYVPIIFDLCPRRSRQKRTWRQLTVAESRQVVSRDVAAGFRFQLDSQQWFFYRSLGPKANRTFLGENFTGEFLFSRFGLDGSVSEMLRIE